MWSRLGRDLKYVPWPQKTLLYQHQHIFWVVSLATTWRLWWSYLSSSILLRSEVTGTRLRGTAASIKTRHFFNPNWPSLMDARTVLILFCWTFSFSVFCCPWASTTWPSQSKLTLSLSLSWPLDLSSFSFAELFLCSVFSCPWVAPIAINQSVTIVVYKDQRRQPLLPYWNWPSLLIARAVFNPFYWAFIFSFLCCL